MEKEEIKPTRCTACQRDLDLGVDAVSLEHGVLGPRGFVPLADRKFFCDEDCLCRHLNGGNVEHLPRRIP